MNEQNSNNMETISLSKEQFMQYTGCMSIENASRVLELFKHIDRVNILASVIS